MLVCGCVHACGCVHVCVMGEGGGGGFTRMFVPIVHDYNLMPFFSVAAPIQSV